MSIKAMTRVWEHSHQKGSNLLALLALADHADDFGECWPSEERIAKKIRMSLRQTQRILAGLESKGEIARKVGDGRGKTTHYLILSGFNAEQKHDKMTSFLNQERVTDLTVKGDILSQKRVTNSTPKKRSNHKTVTNQTTEIAWGEPSLEPSIEPSLNTSTASAAPADPIPSVDLELKSPEPDSVTLFSDALKEAPPVPTPPPSNVSTLPTNPSLALPKGYHYGFMSARIGEHHIFKGKKAICGNQSWGPHFSLIEQPDSVLCPECGAKMAQVIEGKPKRKPKADVPPPAEGVLDALCIMCYGTVEAFKLNASSIRGAYNKIASCCAPVTIEDMRGFYLWWKKTDWRGRKGDKPSPYVVASLWATFKAEQKGVTTDGNNSPSRPHLRGLRTTDFDDDYGAEYIVPGGTGTKSA